MTLSNFPVQFKIGIAGIISSLIWIFVKFGLFEISSFEWISFSGVIFGFALFYHYIGSGKDSTLFLSIVIFFFSITSLVYFHQSKLLNDRLNFEFSFLIFAMGFSLSSFFIVKAFYENKKTKLGLIALVFFLGTIMMIGINSWINAIHLLKNIFKLLEDVEKVLIGLLLISLMFYPLKIIFTSIKVLRKEK